MVKILLGLHKVIADEMTITAKEDRVVTITRAAVVVGLVVEVVGAPQVQDTRATIEISAATIKVVGGVGVHILPQATKALDTKMPTALWVGHPTRLALPRLEAQIETHQLTLGAWLV